MTECTRKTIFGNPACRFEGRFDTGASGFSVDDIRGVTATGIAIIAEKYRTTTYVRDVCTKCGRTIERSK